MQTMTDEQVLATYGGTVSHGTMRAADLLDVLPDVLGTIDAERGARLRSAYEDAFSLHGLIQSGHAEATDTGSELLDEAVRTCFDLLDEVAPSGHYFGAHPGDGSDYGFWAVDSEDGE